MAEQLTLQRFWLLPDGVSVTALFTRQDPDQTVLL
jgi:hypothetical protein